MKRDKFWDSLKFILIFFVVYGHMIETYTPDGSFNRAMYNFIYTFHMPFFMFISGRFSQIKDRKKYLNGIIFILETYIVFQTIRCIKPILAGGTISVSDLISPKGTLWYIAYLAIYRFIMYIVPHKYLNCNPIIIISTSFAIGILWGFMPICTFEKIISFLPYYLMGYYSVQYNIKDKIKKIPLFVSLIGIITIFAIIYIFINYNIGYIIYYEMNYYLVDFKTSPLILCIDRIIVYISAIIISILIMRVVLYTNVFSSYGSTTLFIYMYHTFIILSLRSLISNNFIPQNVILLLIYTILILFSLISLSNISFLRYLMNPITYIKNNLEKCHKNSI